MPHAKRFRYWYRARGTISEAGGQNAHLSALAYMSDNYFIGTVALAQGVSPFAKPSMDVSRQKQMESDKAVKKGTRSPTSLSQTKVSFPTPLTSADSPTPTPTSKEVMNSISSTSNSSATASHQNQAPTVGMMISLDHAIYFHRPREIRADDWLCAEMESPWAGGERGLVVQRIWNRHGMLVATCVQEVS
jgi:acyl-coenzyme A thioesterase 1/2/4